jgi:ADP-ribose pyrophosphatase YjhB (NUDIX family)
MSSSVLSVHKGAKVVLSLCVCRMPTRFVEPEFAQKYRQWKNDWEVRTGNKLNIADGLAYLRTPGHFLPSIEERERRARIQSADTDSGDVTGTVSSKMQNLHVSEIDDLLASEGIPELKLDMEDSRQDAKKSQGSQKQNKDSQTITESVEWLVVKYKSNPDVWTLPFTHRREDESAFTSLMRICKSQIGLKPHLPSLTPISFREINPTGDLIPPTRMFYYKALKVPKSHDVRLPENSEIAEFAWVSRNEVSKRVPRATWSSLRNALPLD